MKRILSLLLVIFMLSAVMTNLSSCWWKKSDNGQQDLFTVSFETGGGSKVEAQNVESGKLATEPATPTRDGYVFIGWYTTSEYKTLFDYTSPITSSCTVYARWADLNDETDTDGDGLTDIGEEFYGTDPSFKDTDGDGLSDYFEIVVLNYDPTIKDTDNNGTWDGDEDFDNDGIINKSEITLGTDISSADTDADLLNDGDEVETYGTDPAIADTDGDGVSDGKEIELGTDPLKHQEAFNMNVSADVKEDEVIPSVEIELSGDQVETLQINAVEDRNFFPETMPGYMGQAYDFSVDGEFESAVISFEFDATELDENADPVIYYFNETTQELEALETTVNGNVASATVTHFSKYILVDRTVYGDSFTWIDVWDSNESYTDIELVFVIDDSGSMTSNDRLYERLTVARDLIDKLPDNSKIGLVRFDGGHTSTMVLTETLTTDKEEVKNYLTRTYFYSPGGTDMYNGILKAFPLYESEEETTLKMMIVLSDGETGDTHLHSSVVSQAQAMGVRIYTVGLGYSVSYFNAYLKPLSDATNALLYTASDAGQLAGIYEDINKKIDIETDSDSDGISDYYEENLVCFNGVQLSLDKYVPDTDGDGVLDGEEIELKYEYNEDKTKVKVTGRFLVGNPMKKDSDGDGYNDDVDFSPFVKYNPPVILVHGWTDNTSCFGVVTKIKDGDNSHYDSDKDGKTDDKTKSGLSYGVAGNHKITNVTYGKLGRYLIQCGYSINNDLHAFNYPNQDMVQYSATKLKAYISDLIVTLKSNYHSSVYANHLLFATKEEFEKGEPNIILIGHSMGGLVSRYYVENLGGEHITKVITIDTPHYGSGLGNASDAFDIAKLIGKFNPAVYDLDTKSTLYGGDVKILDWSIIANRDTRYAINNQSPALKGNKNLDVKYYAVAGYDVGGVTEIAGLAKGLGEHLKNGKSFAIELERDVSNKQAFKNSINGKLNELSMEIYGEASKLDLGDADGDNVVDYMSQLAVRFDGGYDYQSVERSVLILSTGGSSIDSYHNAIHDDVLMHKAVKDFIDD